MPTEDLNAFIQAKLRALNLPSVSVSKAARWLDHAGLLDDAPEFPGGPLGLLLREGQIEGGRLDSKPWHIERLGSTMEQSPQTSNANGLSPGSTSQVVAFPSGVPDKSPEDHPINGPSSWTDAKPASMTSANETRSALDPSVRFDESESRREPSNSGGFEIAISSFIQSYLQTLGLKSAPADELAWWLHRAGVLADDVTSPEPSLLTLLQAERIEGAQLEDELWVVHKVHQPVSGDADLSLQFLDAVRRATPTIAAQVVDSAGRSARVFFTFDEHSQGWTAAHGAIPPDLVPETAEVGSLVTMRSMGPKAFPGSFTVEHDGLPDIEIEFVVGGSNGGTHDRVGSPDTAGHAMAEIRVHHIGRAPQATDEHQDDQPASPSQSRLDHLAAQALAAPAAAASLMIDEPELRIGDVLTNLRSVSDEVVPLASLDTRSANALRNRRCTTWSELAELTIGDLWQAPNVGHLTVSRILTAAATHNLEIAHRSTRPPSHSVVTPPDKRPLDVIGERLKSDLGRVARWAILERDAEYLGDLIDAAPSLGIVPPDLEALLSNLADLPLTNLVGDATPTVLPSLPSEFVAALGERGEMFVARSIRLGDSPTLAELAEPLGLSRERVRQVVAKSTSRAAELREAERFAPLSWRALDLSNALGVATPVEGAKALRAIARACRGLDEPPDLSVRELLLWMAGPYELKDDWLILADHSIAGLSDSFDLKIGDLWLTTVDHAFEVLSDLGVSALEADDLPSLLRGWRAIGDQWLVRWRGTLGDKAEVVYRLTCQPSVAEDLNEHIGEGHAASSVRNILASDERFVRLDKFNTYGLRAWGLEEYSGIAQEIAERIERGGGHAILEDLVIELSEQFGVSESSVRAYAATPAFVLENGGVRLRTPQDAYEVDTRIDSVRGLFVDRTGRVSFNLRVDKDSLRGSGRSLAEAVATSVGLTPGSRDEYTHDASGSTLVLSWPSTSTSGPSIGSVRAATSFLGCKEGDSIRLRFDPATKSVSIDVEDPTSLAGLTGLEIPPGKEIVTLADAIGCAPNLLRSRLQARGDEVLLSLLPQPERSDELDDALSAFGDLL